MFSRIACLSLLVLVGCTGMASSEQPDYSAIVAKPTGRSTQGASLNCCSPLRAFAKG
jgi:hypothetical protein